MSNAAVVPRGLDARKHPSPFAEHHFQVSATSPSAREEAEFDLRPDSFCVEPAGKAEDSHSPNLLWRSLPLCAYLPTHDLHCSGTLHTVLDASFVILSRCICKIASRKG